MKKIILPKIVQICGKKFTVTRNTAEVGGQFNGHKQTIEWNAQTQENADSILLHEINEVIMCEHMLRFRKGGRYEQGDLLFVLTHDDFERFVMELYASLKPYLNFRKKS